MLFRSAKLVYGGNRLTIDGSDCYVEPTIFSDVPIGSTIAREEIFGPVLSAFVFDSEEQAVKMANNSVFGLAASVWTGNLRRAHRVADALRLQGVAEGGMGGLLRGVGLEEVLHLVDEAVLVADRQSRHLPVAHVGMVAVGDVEDRKSTRLNSSH